jgi:hypothetical protein
MAMQLSKNSIGLLHFCRSSPSSSPSSFGSSTASFESSVEEYVEVEEEEEEVAIAEDEAACQCEKINFSRKHGKRNT